MTGGDIAVAVELEMSLGECPLWSVLHQTLYWVDINHGHLYAWRPDSGRAPQRVELGDKVGCLALGEDGLLAATAPGIDRLEFPLGSKRERLVDNPEWRQGDGNRFNDGRCDAAGRFWLGTLAADEASPSAALYCFAEGKLERRRSGIAISNGLAFSPDGRWLYHTDSPTRRILRHSFEVGSGVIGEGETWVDLEREGLPGVPDGAAVDSDGNYWSALYGGGRVVCFSPEGRLLASHEVPCPHPTMVAFGGPELSTLYITTATQHLDKGGWSRWPLAGSLLSMPAPIAGLAEPQFI
ncbi:SMP-30/gluconolactonase/LRE family protein [Halomonas lysinitropha]|uniref:L-arabinolactonase n=1 Tax=Halomonas lysinitropha TaxID=2607506 RepID=A0A5K1HXI4_9GAMM|nr:SMP-30/gluconolactonase/LRE family protein [Halomonas lysinitropha]VVZ94334.1 L-arabinolactonase [Halomonas lysinitropha]